MQFLTLSRRRTDAFSPEAFTPELVAQEAQRVKELYATGLCARFGSAGTCRAPRSSGSPAGEPEVRDAIASLPIFKAGMLELVALVPLEPYAGFGPGAGFGPAK